VVENNADLAQTLAIVMDLEPDLQSVGFSCSGADAVARAVEARADIMVLDFSLPGGNALTVLDDCRERGAPIDVLIYTGHGAPEFVAAAQSRGAAGYVVKGGPFEELAGEIRRIYAARQAGGITPP
jgi:two-component system response regulator DesR